VFLLRRLERTSDGEEIWLSLGRANSPLRSGTRVDAGRIAVEVLGRAEDSLLRVKLTASPSVSEAIAAEGHVPLPPYMRRSDDVQDVERYQTVFARHEGSVAAPTAGLHLTDAALERLKARGVEVCYLTLHVGLGTFRPVTADDLDEHPMHEEWFSVSDALAASVERARDRGASVVAVGTTVVRALESARDPENPRLVRPMEAQTRLLIQPGYAFGPVDALLTNFHMPKSTLLALVSAFAGRDRVLAAYAHAVAAGYRFLSYGDAMWIPERLS
jgi:S-adenosylmethionine:tRNA ribosyltransferase-isomerase